MFYLLYNTPESDDLLEFFDMKQEGTKFPKIFLSHIDNRAAKMEKYEYQKVRFTKPSISNFSPKLKYRMK